MGTKAGKKMKKENRSHVSIQGLGVADFPLSNCSLMSFHHLSSSNNYKLDSSWLVGEPNPTPSQDTHSTLLTPGLSYQQL